MLSYYDIYPTGCVMQVQYDPWYHKDIVISPGDQHLPGSKTLTFVAWLASENSEKELPNPYSDFLRTLGLDIPSDGLKGVVRLTGLLDPTDDTLQDLPPDILQLLCDYQEEHFPHPPLPRKFRMNSALALYPSGAVVWVTYHPTRFLDCAQDRVGGSIERLPHTDDPVCDAWVSDSGILRNLTRNPFADLLRHRGFYVPPCGIRGVVLLTGLSNPESGDPESLPDDLFLPIFDYQDKHFPDALPDESSEAQYPYK